VIGTVPSLNNSRSVSHLLGLAARCASVALALLAGAVACGSSGSGARDAQDGATSDDAAGGEGGPDTLPDSAADVAADADGSTPAPTATQSLTLGFDFACAIKKSGDTKCWGENSILGKLGLGDTIDRGGMPGQMGAALPVVKLGAGRRATSISAGLAHTCVVLDDGHAKCWGFNSDGELGIGDPTSRGANAGDMGDALPSVDLGTGRTAKSIAAGEDHTCAILDDGHVKCWGANLHGELGLGDVASRGAPAGEMGDSLPAVVLGSGRTAVALALGTYRTCALLDDASVKCWGWNGAGYLGIGDTNDRGDQPGEMGDALPRVNLGTGRHALSIAAASETTCAVLDDGSLKCWGFAFGVFPTQAWGKSPSEMGNALPAYDLGTGRKVKAVALGASHSCAILDDDTLKCWGVNGDGELGLGDTAARGDQPAQMGDALPRVDLSAGRKVVAVALGTSSSCAVLDGGDLRCWGKNDVGQLGLGDKANRGDAPGEMGAALPNVDLGP
jgi:alpha-tubulin suppressor-like RCC1 family protein